MQSTGKSSHEILDAIDNEAKRWPYKIEYIDVEYGQGSSDRNGGNPGAGGD